MNNNFSDEKNNRVSRFPISGNRESAGIGFIMIPIDIDRDIYIQNCAKNGSVSIITENSGRFDNVLVSKEIFQELIFPLNNEEIGTSVIWINIPDHNQPTIIGTIIKKNEILQYDEGTKHEKISTLNSTINTIKDSNEGNYTVNINVSDSNIGGEILFKVNNGGGNAKFTIEVDGQVLIYARDEVSLNAGNSFYIGIIDNEELTAQSFIQYTKGKGLFYKDEFDNYIEANSDYVSINGKVIMMGDGKEGACLAETLQLLLNDFIDAVSQITVTTFLGVQPIINQMQISSLKQRTQDIISKYLFIQ